MLYKNETIFSLEWKSICHENLPVLTTPVFQKFYTIQYFRLGDYRVVVLLSKHLGLRLPTNDYVPLDGRRRTHDILRRRSRLVNLRVSAPCNFEGIEGTLLLQLFFKTEVWNICYQKAKGKVFMQDDHNHQTERGNEMYCGPLLIRIEVDSSTWKGKRDVLWAPIDSYRSTILFPCHSITAEPWSGWSAPVSLWLEQIFKRFF